MNVGDYVRIINTLNDYVEIIKIKELNEYDGYLLDERNYQYSTDEIIKSSPQIIDLIQCSDYVNGYKVIGIVKGFKILVDKLELDTTTGLYHHKSIMTKNIKTIITHEQMEAIQYRVEE